MSLLRWALFVIPLTMLLGFLSGTMSGSTADNAWYQTLIKPDIQPPGWVFGVVWPTLYLLMGLAFAMVLVMPGFSTLRPSPRFFAPLAGASWLGVKVNAPASAGLSPAITESSTVCCSAPSRADQATLTVAALMTANRHQQLEAHLGLALKNGVTREELGEALLHLAFYASWPASITASRMLLDLVNKQDADGSAG
eukprot:gene37851-51103_t